MPIRAIDPARRADTPSTIQDAGQAGATIVVTRARNRPLPHTPPRPHHTVDRTSANWDENGEYIVGKGKPPKAAQWQKGQSGNPRGPKPREKADPATDFHKEVLANFQAKVGGEEKTLSMGSFVLTLLKAGAAKGSVKSQQMLLDLYLAAVKHQSEREATPEILAWEEQTIDDILKALGLPEAPLRRKSRASIEDNPAPTNNKDGD